MMKNHHHSWLDIPWKWLSSGGHLVFRKCTSFLFCVSLSGMMKSWPVKIQEKGTPDQERGRSQHLGPVKIVKPNRPHGNSIYPTDVSVWTALKVRTRTVTISFPWRIIPGSGTETASLSSLFARQANVSTLPVACVLPPPPRFFFFEGRRWYLFIDVSQRTCCFSVACSIASHSGVFSF